MKKITTIILLFIGSIAFAQSNLTIFNNNGQQFYVILNGIKQNSVPMTNVSVGGIKNGSYSVKLIFSDGKTADIDKNFTITEPSDITTRVVFKKGKGKLQLVDMQASKGAMTAEEVIVYRPDNNAVYSDAVVVTETIQTTSTTTSTNGQTEQVGINMNVGVNETQNTTGVNQTVTVTDPNNSNGNVGANININVQDPVNGGETINMSVNMNGQGTSSQATNTSGNMEYSETVTTTITTSGTQTNTINTNTQTSVASDNTPVNTVTCKNILNDGNAFVEDINSINFDADKMDLIKKDLRNHCLTASQAYKIIETLSFEADRFEIAKYLYDRMIDKDNGKSLLPLFTFDSTKTEYREYIRK